MKLSKKDNTKEEVENISELEEMAEESLFEEEQDEELNLELDEVTILKAKIEELEDSKLREQAEFENLKKRYEREKLSAIAYSNEGFARDLLGVIDSLDNASKLEIDTENIEDSLLKIKEGIDLTIEQVYKVLTKNGIEEVGFDDGFDPNHHEAIMQIDNEDSQKGDIVQVFQKGYKLRDRILRPAMVSIAK